LLSLKQQGEKQFSDERIIGSGKFVKEILEEAVKAEVTVSSRKESAMEALANRCVGSAQARTPIPVNFEH
jgi:putative transposase